MKLRNLMLISWLTSFLSSSVAVDDRFKTKNYPCAENGAFFHRPSRPFKPHRNRKFHKKLRYESPCA